MMKKEQQHQQKKGTIWLKTRETRQVNIKKNVSSLITYKLYNCFFMDWIGVDDMNKCY